MNLTWKSVESQSLSNLHVLEKDGKEVGLMYRPKNTKTDKNAWRCYNGIGDASKFLGHSYKKTEAKKIVEQSV